MNPKNNFDLDLFKKFNLTFEITLNSPFHIV